jgi:ligand-binding sensor domain-containing protein
VRKTLQAVRALFAVLSLELFESSTRVANSQLNWLVLLLVITSASTSFGQPLPSARSQVDSESWTFKDGASANIRCLAQTNDGFLWLCSQNGLVKFDGTRFEPFRSPFGDQLLSAKAHSLFAPRSGGLWVGYTFGGFSFLENGRVANYASETGSVYGFAQDQNGIVWAGTSSGLWRFDHSAWQHIGVEWNAPTGSARQVGFDSQGTLWVCWLAV